MRNLAPTSTYRPRAIYLHGPPGTFPQWPATRRPSLFQFFFLSMLVHALAIMLFGAPSGGSREGRAIWGSLQVVLDPMLQGPPALKVERTLGALRSIPSPRRERVVPPAPPAPAPPVDLSVSKRIEPRPVTRVEPEATLPVPVETPLFVPQFLDRITAPEITREMAPPLRLPAPTQPQVVAPPVVERLPAEAPAIPAPVAQPLTPVETPIVPAVPIATPIERPLVETRAIPVPPVESVAPPRVEIPAPPVEKPLVPEAPPVERAPPRIEERVVPRTIERAPPVPEPAMPAPPFRVPAPPVDADRGGGASTFDPTAPGVDLDALRKRAGQIAREGTGNRAILPFPMPGPGERKTKMETALEKARKPDCRTAHQSLGLLAVIPLIANEFGEGNCRW